MELLIWQLIAGAECALVLLLAARCLRYREDWLVYRSAFIDRQGRIDRLEMESAKLRCAMVGIKRLDTPKAAHGVKKAVAIAKEALGK